jgi:hypothetical protein
MSVAIVSTQNEMMQILQECKQMGVKKIKIKIPVKSELVCRTEVNFGGFTVVRESFEPTYRVMTLKLK